MPVQGGDDLFKTAIIKFAERSIGLGWRSENFTKFRQLGLKKFGTYVDGCDIYISNSAGNDYQVAACLFEYLRPESTPEFIIEGCETSEKLERKIIMDFVPSKKRNEYARQRRIFFKALIADEPENESHQKVLAMLELLIPSL